MTQESSMQQSIDWQSVWDTLNWDNEERQATTLAQQLHQRAQQYATPIIRDDLTSDKHVMTLLAFSLGTERYAVDVHRVIGVRNIRRITRVPNAPAFYRGVVNVRGQILTVLDLEAYFGIRTDESIAYSELIIVNGHGLELGILVDEIQEIVRLPEETIETIDMPHTHGITLNKLIILDMDSLLTDSRLIIGGHHEG